MAVAFRAKSVGSVNGTTGTVTFTDPGTAGDLLLAVFCQDGTIGWSTSDPGWTSLGLTQMTFDGQSAEVWYKKQSAGGGGTITFSGQTPNVFGPDPLYYMAMYAYSGADATNPINVLPVGIQDTPGPQNSTWTITSPSVTTTVNGCLLVSLIFTDQTDTGTATVSALPSGYTQRDFATVSTCGFTCVGVAEKTQSTAGATGTAVWTLSLASPATDAEVVGYMVAIAPAAGGGGNTMTVAATVPGPTSSASLASTDAVTVAATVAAPTSSAAVASTDRMTVAGTVPAPTSATALTNANTLATSATVPAPTSVAALASTDTLTVTATIPGPTCAASMAATLVAVVASPIPVPTSAASLASTDVVAVGATVPAPTSAATLASTDIVAVAATVPGPTCTASLTSGGSPMDVASAIAAPSCAAAMASTDALVVAGLAPGPTMTATLSAGEVMAIAGLVPGPTCLALLTVPMAIPDYVSPWAKIMKPRYARWRRRTGGF